MSDDHEFFPPDHQDERLVEDLSICYQDERELDVASLKHAWSRIATRLPESAIPPHTNPRPSSLPMMRFPQERVYSMHAVIPEHPRKQSAFQHRLALLIAVVLMAVLVGSLTVVLNLVRSNSMGGPAASTRMHQRGSGPGQIVYSSPVEHGFVSSVAWSADGQRLAIGSNTVEIWDALTGQHRVTTKIALDELSDAGLAWSPNAERLAVTTDTSITIVDGKTGKTVTEYPAQITSSTIPSGMMTWDTTPGKAYFASRVHLGGAPHFDGVAWSPDGKQIVSTFSASTSAGLVQVWDPQTGQQADTLARQPGRAFGDVAWSPDGRYIAATSWQWDGSQYSVDVWNVQTHQLAFSQQTSNDEFSSVTWQPGTDNLACTESLLGNIGSKVANVAKVWNVSTGQLVQSLSGVVALSWSPDGRSASYAYAAENDTVSHVVIKDVDSDKTIYTYAMSGISPATAMLTPSNPAVVAKDQGGSISVPYWSSDSKYIATFEVVNPSASEVTPAPGSGFVPAGAFVVRVQTV